MYGDQSGELLCYTEVLFRVHVFQYYWGEENHSLYQTLSYIEVCYIKVPLYQKSKSIKCKGSVYKHTTLVCVKIIKFFKGQSINPLFRGIWDCWRFDCFYHLSCLKITINKCQIIGKNVSHGCGISILGLPLWSSLILQQ